MTITLLTKTIDQVISTAPTAPSAGDSSTFDDLADPFMKYIEDMDSEYNIYGTEFNEVSADINSRIAEINTTANDVSNDANNASTARDSALGYSNTAASLATATATDRDYVAEQSAFVASIYGLVGIGIDSAGNLSANINSESNISDMELNSDGELIVTYS